MICNHQVIVIDSFHRPDGAFTRCLRCNGDMFITSDEMEQRLPFIFTSPGGKKRDIIVLIKPEDFNV